MNSLRNAAQAALEALEASGCLAFKNIMCRCSELCRSYTAAQHLRAALAQQAEPVEPVAWVYTGIKQDGTEHGPHLVWKPEYMDAMSASKGAKATPLYTAPPRQSDPQIEDRLARHGIPKP